MVHDVHQGDPLLGRVEGPEAHLHPQLQLVVLQDALDSEGHETRVREAKELEIVALHEPQALARLRIPELLGHGGVHVAVVVHGGNVQLLFGP